MSARLSLAAASGVLPISSEQTALLIGAPASLDLSAFGEAKITVVQDMMPDAAAWERKGIKVQSAVPEAQFDAVLVTLPRAKEAARARIAAAMTASRGVVLMDGQKTDGVDSLLKEMRKRAPVEGPISKAHGKLFWCAPSDVFADWVASPKVIDGRWRTVPGVFSADAVDQGSQLLAEHVPATLRGVVADLGAGWGYLSAQVLERNPGITALHLLEAHGAALDCARTNVTDPRAQFHWADATTWTAPAKLDAVIMNPPFHTGRAAEPDLGRAFIASAARMLKPGADLWMVANRHLPYERTLHENFAECAEISGTSKFKLFHAKTGSRAKR